MMFPEAVWTEDTKLLIELRDLERSEEWGRLEVCANQILAQCPISVLALKGLGKALEK